MLDSAEFKAAIIHTFKELKETMFKYLKGGYYDNVSSNREANKKKFYKIIK